MLTNRRLIELALEKPLPDDDSEENAYRSNMLGYFRNKAYIDIGADDADAVAVDAAIAALRSADSLECRAALLGWLWGIYQNVLMDALRKRQRLRRQIGVGLDPTIIAPQMNSASLRKLHDPILVKHLEAAFRQLPASDAEIVWRFYVDDQPFDQIMDEMRLTFKQFSLKKSRAIAKLTYEFRGKPKETQSHQATKCTVNGQTRSIAEWARYLNQDYDSLYGRYRRHTLRNYIAQLLGECKGIA